MSEKIESIYNEIKEKYDLPTFSKLDQEFELSLLKNTNKSILLKQIRRKITNKIIFFCKILEGIVHPANSSIIPMYETKFFDDEQKDKITALLKELMFIERRSMMLDVSSEQKQDAEFIKEILDSWEKLKKPMLKISEKMKDGWKTEEKLDLEDYFG